MTNRFSIVEAIKKMPWAITESGLDLVLAVASRDMESLSKYRDKRLGNTQDTRVRNGVAVIPVFGPIIKGGSNFSDVSAATSYRSIMVDFQQALDTEEVHSILLDIDSPGGQAIGNSELSDFIFDNRNKKPIYSYIGGYGCSAAYWIASASKKIFANKNAVLGSIGCMGIVDNKKNPDELKFIASISPNKNMEIDSEPGKEEFQNLIDSLGNDFVEGVAKNRSVTIQTVLDKYGQGKTFMGTQALAQGLCDEISTFEKTLSIIQKENQMSLTAESLQKDHPKIASHFINEGKNEIQASMAIEIENAKNKERIRIASILELENSDNKTLIQAAVSDPKATAESVSLQIVKEQIKNPKNQSNTPVISAEDKHKAVLKSAEGSFDSPDNSSGKNEDSDEETIKKEMANFSQEGI